MTRLLVGFVALALLAPSLLRADTPPAKPPATQPALSDAEKQAGWTLLFDGVSTKGLRGLGTDGFPDGRWVVENGYLHCLGNALGKGKSDDVITDRTYDNFELQFEWMIPKKLGNSGVKYRVQEVKGEGFAFGPEYQLMNDPGVENKDATGSLYDVLPPHGKVLKPDGEFNASRILVRGSHVEHWLNGVKVVEFEFGSDEMKRAVAQSKFKSEPKWAAIPKGHIALQDHTDEAWFRNLKIRELPAEQ